MNTIGIIGGGFTGTMTAVQLIERASGSLAITLINESGPLARGIAYDPYSAQHLLNVPASKMSAFPDRPDHFLDHVMALPAFQGLERALVGSAFLPRRLYGDYLAEVWASALAIAAEKRISVQVLEDRVTDLDMTDDAVRLSLRNAGPILVDRCVIASGNQVPRDPSIDDPAFYSSDRYFRDPWKAASVNGVDPELPVLIIGNGLTMVDTVLGLLEQGFANTIWSISPHGYSMLPHRHNGLVYTKLAAELNDGLTLRELVPLVNRHIRAVRALGISAEPVIDSLRPHVQRIWQRLSPAERRTFMARLRHLWGVARHRVPLHTHDRLQQLRIDGRLRVIAGRPTAMRSEGDSVIVEYVDRKRSMPGTLKVSRVINCTGPMTDLEAMEGGFLKACHEKGFLHQDELKLGIRADTGTFAVFDGSGRPHGRLFTLGSTLRGELWESTAVNELRSQAAALADKLLAGRA